MFKKPDAYKSINSSQYLIRNSNEEKIYNNEEDEIFYYILKYFKNIYLHCL